MSQRAILKRLHMHAEPTDYGLEYWLGARLHCRVVLLVLLGVLGSATLLVHEVAEVLVIIKSHPRGASDFTRRIAHSGAGRGNDTGSV